MNFFDNPIANRKNAEQYARKRGQMLFLVAPLTSHRLVRYEGSHTDDLRLAKGERAMCREITGRVFESATLGRCEAPQSGYLPRREALDLVRKCQPKQKRPAAARLEAEVMKHLGITAEFFTAVSSTLDHFHSVDAFFVVGAVIVTIDVTTNPHKCFGKADVIIQADDFENLAALAGRIANECKRQLALCSRRRAA